MNFKERIIHAILFELGALTLGAMVVKLLSHDTETSTAFLLGVILAAVAMILNIVFNYFFDKIFTGKREERGALFRLFHTTAFEAALLLFTIPIVAYMLNLSLWRAFLADIGMTLAIMVYAFIFNWVYDCARLRFVS